MSGIQHSTLSDDEFERAVYMAMNSAGSLPVEVAKELELRIVKQGRDWEKFQNTLNHKQLPLPFNE